MVRKSLPAKVGRMPNNNKPTRVPEVVAFSSSSSSAVVNGNELQEDDTSITAASHEEESSSNDNNRRDAAARWGNIDAMTKIEKSPYEYNESAEVGEEVFDEVQSLMFHGQDGRLKARAIEALGHRLASSVVAANAQIGISGILYSSSWQEGKIRSVQCGWIPKAMLLVCLHEQRFTRHHEDAVLLSIIKDLGVAKIILDALQDFDLEDQYLSLVASLLAFSFVRQKQQCYKCAIFVARAYRCVKVLKYAHAPPSLMAKIKRCLDIMTQHIKVNKGAVARLQAEKRKPKPKKTTEKQQQQQNKRSFDSLNVASNRSAARVDTVESSPESSLEPHAKRPRYEPMNHNNNNDDDSVEALLKSVEQQYKTLGETIIKLKQKIQKDKQEQMMVAGKKKGKR